MKTGLTKELMALRAVRELKDGMFVNLGIGLPTLISQFVSQDIEVVFHSENGILGYQSIDSDEEMDIDLVNAGLQPVKLLPGASVFNQADSFAMIRGGHLDLTILGAYQVSVDGDLANWMRPGETLGAIGGAMDLVGGTKKIMVLMQHIMPSGDPRIVTRCTYPITGKKVVNFILTNLAFIEVSMQGLVLKETAPGLSVADIQSVTEPALIVSREVKEMEL
ncbi:3-oxoacid CoA-transferase subunit B [Chloroflexota bacterium]